MNIRGSALLHARGYLQSRWGVDMTGRLLAKLPPAARDVVASPDLSPHAWHPVSVWNALADEVTRWPGRQGAVRDIAAYAAEQDLTVAHGVLLKLGQPSLVMRQAGVLWANYFNGGQLVPFALAERRFRLVLQVGVDPLTDPGRSTCREAVPAWQERALRLSGAREGRSLHVKCRFEGHAGCEYLVHWEA